MNKDKELKKLDITVTEIEDDGPRDAKLLVDMSDESAEELYQWGLEKIKDDRQSVIQYAIRRMLEDFVEEHKDELEDNVDE